MSLLETNGPLILFLAQGNFKGLLEVHDWHKLGLTLIFQYSIPRDLIPTSE